MKNKIGSYLRQHRENRKLTLQQAAEETGIREPYLAALEEGDFHKIPGDVFIRGFLRNYGNYLGLDGNGLVEAYRTGSEPEKILKAVEESVPSPSPSTDTLILRREPAAPAETAVPAKQAVAPSEADGEPFDKVTALKQMEPVGHGAAHRPNQDKVPAARQEPAAEKASMEATRIMAPVRPSPAETKETAKMEEPVSPQQEASPTEQPDQEKQAGNGKAKKQDHKDQSSQGAQPKGKEDLSNSQIEKPSHLQKEGLEPMEQALDREHMEEVLDAGRTHGGNWLDRIRDFIDENLYETVPEDEAGEEFGATSAGDSKAPAFSFKVFTTVFVVCLAVFTLVMAYFVFGGKTSPELKTTNTITDGVKSDHSSEKSEKNKKATEAAAPKKEEEPKGDTKTLGKGSGLTVVVTYKKPVWTQTTIDGRQVEATTVAKGSTRTYKGDKSVSVNFGSIRDVVITVNGKEVPYGSKEWGVVTRTFKAK